MFDSLKVMYPKFWWRFRTWKLSCETNAIKTYSNLGAVKIWKMMLENRKAIETKKWIIEYMIWQLDQVGSVSPIEEVEELTDDEGWNYEKIQQSLCQA